MDALLDERAAAGRLRVSVALLRKWRVNHIGPVFYRIGRAIRYSEQDLVSFVESNRVHAATTGINSEELR
jgi:hypothetical protein